jgi:hypothetical protein
MSDFFEDANAIVCVDGSTDVNANVCAKTDRTDVNANANV